jgi:hypothetical protein
MGTDGMEPKERLASANAVPIPEQLSRLFKYTA